MHIRLRHFLQNIKLAYNSWVVLKDKDGVVFVKILDTIFNTGVYVMKLWLLNWYLKSSSLCDVLLYMMMTYFCSKVLNVFHAETIVDLLPQQDHDPYRDPFNHPTIVEGIPICASGQCSVDMDEPADGNLTCENAAYNERPTLPDNTTFEAETMQRVEFIDGTVRQVVKIIILRYGDVAPPEEFVKNTTITVLKNQQDLSTWLAKTEEEVKSAVHEANLRVEIMQTILKNTHDKLNPLEKSVLSHLLTSVTLLNSASALHISPENTAKLFTGDFYNQMFTKVTK